MISEIQATPRAGGRPCSFFAPIQLARSNEVLGSSVWEVILVGEDDQGAELVYKGARDDA
jgi:hypothetical protein